MLQKNYYRTYKTRDFDITISKKWENKMLNEYKKVNEYLIKTNNSKIYNPLIDVLFHSNEKYKNVFDELNKKNKISKKYFITPSKNLPNVENGKNKNSLTIVNYSNGTLIRKYWIKKLDNINIVVKDPFESRFLQKLYDLKTKEAKDAIKIKKLGIKTPEFVINLKIPKNKITISAYEQIKNYLPATTLFKSLSKKEKKELLKKIEKLGKKLINAGLLPSIFRSNEILVNKKNLNDFMLTDTATGFSPISRNKVLILEELKSNPKIKKPNWKKIQNNTLEFSKYWKKIPKNIQKKIQYKSLKNVLNEIKTGKKDNLDKIKSRINILLEDLALK